MGASHHPPGTQPTCLADEVAEYLLACQVEGKAPRTVALRLLAIEAHRRLSPS